MQLKIVLKLTVVKMTVKDCHSQQNKRVKVLFCKGKEDIVTILKSWTFGVSLDNFLNQILHLYSQLKRCK